MDNMFFIDSSLLKKLVDPAVDVRVRALNEVSASLKNNIPFNSSSGSSDDFAFVDLHNLVRQLIKWFQIRPIWYEREVLDMLRLIFRRRDLLRHVVKNIGVKRLKAEFTKIGNLVISDESTAKLLDLVQMVEGYESSVLIDFSDQMEPSYVDSPEFTVVTSRRTLSRQKMLHESPLLSEISNPWEHQVESEVNPFWEVLNGLNLDIFNGIEAELLMYNESYHLRNVLNFLKNSVNDFPPEFFLQQPNIVDRLMNIMHKVPEKYSIEIIKIVGFVINKLRDRCLESIKLEKESESKVVSIKKQVNNILQLLTNFFEGFHDSFNVNNFVKSQNLLNEMYFLLLAVADFIVETKKTCEIFINNLMNAIAKVVKDLRVCYATAREDSGVVRLHYMLCLYVINALSTCVSAENIKNYSENNVWEFESDVALIDGALSLPKNGIYSLIEKNREAAIQDDNELLLLLESRKVWKPVVKIFQSWETMNEEEIILTGLEALNTIRIHRSLELVELLMEAVKKCAWQFENHEDLKTAAEEIYLRLLSVEVPEIRQRAYEIVCKSTHEKMSSDENTPASLCCAVGFPLTTEIITEILCFGLTDNNEKVQRSAKKILFLVFRSQVAFQTHWNEIGDVIKPILPLLPSVCRKNQALGTFAFELLEPNSIFDEFELNQGYARFLYSNSSSIREEAKQKLLKNYKFDVSLVDIVPENFCILSESKVNELQMPENNIGFDVDAFENSFQVLKTIGRSDPEVLQSVLLQINVLMNSRELCQKSHDENMWVFFMASLDMGFPEHVGIRSMTINILYKWVVCISQFRIYLANEPTVLEFLVKTLVYFQDDQQIKKRTSWLLFLLLFSDFLVTNERKISMPKFLSQLCCPFKFDKHWTESPFNKISALEQLYEEMEQHSEATEVCEISRNFLKFSFAREWFPVWTMMISSDNFTSNVYYKTCSEKAMKISENLQLTPSDVKCVRNTNFYQIVEKLCRELENMTGIPHALATITKIQTLLIPPIVVEKTIAEKLDKNIFRLVLYSDEQQEMLIGFLRIYRKILSSLSDERIVNLMRNKFIERIIMKKIDFMPEATIEALNLINDVVKLCGQRSSLADLLIKNFEKDLKVFLPTRIVEQFTAHIFDDLMMDDKWHEFSRRPEVKNFLEVVLNVLAYLPVHLDELYLRHLFEKFLAVPIALYRSHLDHLKMKQTLHINSSMLKIVFGILWKIASSANQINLKAERVKDLMFWAVEDQRKFKTLPWMIVAQLTKKKENFEAFCKEYREAMRVPLFITVLETITKRNNLTSLDLKAVTAVYGNLLDFSTDTIDSSFTNLIFDEVVKSGNTPALCFIVRKMIQNDLPGISELISSRGIVRKFLNNIEDHNDLAQQFEAIATCHKFKSLSIHVVDTVTADVDLGFMFKFSDTKKEGEEFKKFNRNAFNVLLILMSTESGVMKIGRALSNPQVIDRLMFAAHDGLRVSNTHSEIVFMLSFWNSLIDASEKFSSPIVNRLAGHTLDVMSKKCVFVSEEKDEEKLRINFKSPLEQEFGRVCFAIDLLFLQVVSIFEFIFVSKFSIEYKHELKLLCFLIIKKLSAVGRVKQLLREVDLMSIVTDKLGMTLDVMQRNRHLETTKRSGVLKCQYLIKDLVIFLKAFSEWNLPLIRNTKEVQEIFKEVLKVSDWLEADSNLMNCLLNLMQLVTTMDVGRSCVMMEMKGVPLVKIILGKTLSLSSKPPHTENNMSLIRNGLSAIKSCSNFIEVRVMLKNTKLFQTLEVLHPQLHPTRKTSWDDVTIEWMKFFEVLSQFEDTECQPHNVSLLCRLFRLGNATIKKITLSIIHNFSLRASIGFVLINSEDFKQTVDSVLTCSSDYNEKFLILQTLLAIATKSEQLKAKLKNSSLNRKLKDQLLIMQSERNPCTNIDHVKNLHLIKKLLNLLYPKEY